MYEALCSPVVLPTDADLDKIHSAGLELQFQFQICQI